MVKNNSKRIKGYWVLIASAFAFSLMTVCVKHLDGRLPVAEIVMIRSLISILITRLMINKAGISPWGENRKLLIVRGILGTSALFCVFKAIAYLPLAAATIIQYTYPTFTALAAWIFLKEGISYRIGLAIIMGWIGIVMVSQSDWIHSSHNTISIIPISIALAGAFLTAMAYITVRKLSKKEHPLVIVYYFPLLSIPITIPLVLTNWVMPLGIEWGWLIGIGLFTQLGQVCITKGLSLLPAAQASSINYTQVLFSSIWGFIIFSEKVDVWIITGALFVMGSTLLSIRNKRA